ncbi:MAG: PKD domain-containing protein [bacterium]|nr:PKD domain-containing protein [bacterium]
MPKKISLLIAIVFFFIAFSNRPALNTPVCTELQEQKRPQLTADGAGGAILIWEDSRNGSDYDIYAQRLDSTGTAQWKDGGVTVCTAIGPQRYPQVTADRSGGFIVTWFDRRGGKNADIYAQRLDSKGTATWPVDGVPICTADSDQYDPVPVADADGGAVIVWQDRRNGNDYDVYAQRIDSSGTVKWDANGVVICTEKEDQDNLRSISDGSGGAVILWQDRRNGNDYDIYAQRIDSMGRVQWGVNGAAVCSAKEDQRLPQMVSDNKGSVVLAWQDKRNGSDYDVYAQRLDASGTSQWTADGVVICKAANSQYEPRLASDSNGGAVIAWQDYRRGEDCTFDAFDEKNDLKADVCDEKQLNDWNIYAQHINASGRVQWTENGVTISTANVDQYKPQPVADGLGGTIITWRAADKENDHNIYAQRLDSSGAPKWSAAGVPVTVASGNQMDPLLVSDGMGGAIVAWYDKRRGNNHDIYAQKVCASGEIGGCSQPVAVIAADNRGLSELTLKFDSGKSYDPDGSITGWRWNFGDGKQANNENVTHTYSNPGTYNVTLRVRDNNGKWSTPVRKRVKVSPTSS